MNELSMSILESVSERVRRRREAWSCWRKNILRVAGMIRSLRIQALEVGERHYRLQSRRAISSGTAGEPDRWYVQRETALSSEFDGDPYKPSRVEKPLPKQDIHQRWCNGGTVRYSKQTGSMMMPFMR
jgi:hypothetical protein